MSGPALYLFDDAVARNWAPFHRTRPIGTLLCGTRTLARRAAEAVNASAVRLIVPSGLADFDEPGAPECVALEDVPRHERRILLSSRVLLDWPPAMPDSEGRIELDGQTVGWFLSAGTRTPDAESVLRPADSELTASTLPVEGTLLQGPWDLMALNASKLRQDLDDRGGEDVRLDGVHRIGDDPLVLGEDAVVEPGVVVDTRNGPVHVDAGARVEAPARLVGPLWIGPGSTVLGGHVAASSIGPVCKVRGEVSDVIFLGYANKAHDGHLGHAVVGRWVNLGAGTSNSDLKNNYGTVRVWTPGGEADTGLMKVGCFLGDHVKTAIGTLINTGTVAEVGANLFGPPPPKYVPPFAWGSDPDGGPFRLDAFLEVAERAMGRRGEELTPGVRTILSSAWTDAHGPAS